MPTKKIVTAFKINSDKDLMKYLLKLIQERAKEQDKDIWDVSPEDIYKALTKLRKSWPTKLIFRTKMSTLSSIQKKSSLAMDGVTIASTGLLGGLYVGVKRAFLKIFAKPIKQKVKNITLSQLVDYLAKETYKPKRKRKKRKPSKAS